MSFKDLKDAFVENEPRVFATVGVIGFGLTIGAAIGATIFAMRACDKKRKEKIEEEKEKAKKFGEVDETIEKRIIDSTKTKLTKTETVKIVWKYYIPVVVLGLASGYCVYKCDKLYTSKILTITAAYKLNEKTLLEYKNKVKEVIGEKEEKKVQDSLAQQRVNDTPPDEGVEYTGCGETLCHENLTGRYFRSNKQSIGDAINQLNAKMIGGMEMWVSVNDFFDQVSLSEVTLGDDMGWHVDKGMIEPIFSSALTSDGTPVLDVDFRILPSPRPDHLI